MNKRIRFISIIIIGIILLSIFSYISYKLYNNYLITKFITEQKELQINYNKEQIEYSEKDIEDIKKNEFDNEMELIIEKNNDIDVANKNIDNLLKMKINKDILIELIRQNENLINMYNDKYKRNIKASVHNEKAYKNDIKKAKNIIQTCDNYLENKRYLFSNIMEDVRILKNDYNDIKEYIKINDVPHQERILKVIKVNSKEIIQLQEQSKNINNVINKSNKDIRILLEKYLLSIDTIVAKLEEQNSILKQAQALHVEMLNSKEECKNKILEVIEFLEKMIYK